MGLRVEQHNIEDLLKYFIARNEFKRRNVVEMLKDLTDEERAKLNISNYAEFYNYYRFLYKVLKQDIVEGSKTTIINNVDLIGRSYYEKEFLLKYPFQYILELRLVDELTRDHGFIFDSLEDNAWQAIGTGGNVNLADFGITVSGEPDNDDALKVNYIAYNGTNHETATITIEQGKERLSNPTIDVATFGKKIRSLSKLNYTSETTVGELFQKIIDSNPDVTSSYEDTMLISPEYSIYNNSETNCKLNDLFTFTSNIYYMSDKDVEGLTEKTKNTIILAALRKILDDRKIPYKETDYLVNVKYDSNNEIKSYDLVIDNLLNLVLNTNPLTKNDLHDGKDETFRSLQSEIISLKAYVNEYVVNETKYSGNKYFMKNGKANYSGYSLATVIPHNTGLMPASIIINNVNPDSIIDTGDVYVKSDTKNIYVYNTGKNRSEFEFTIIFDTGDYLEFPKDKSFEEFIEICINSIKKIKLDNSLIRQKNGKIIIHLLDINNESLFHKFDFLVITNNETKEDSYYRVDDAELFEYNEVDKTLTIISDKVKVSLKDTFYITAMHIDDAPIMYLLNQLLMNPNFYIQPVVNFLDLIFKPTDFEFEEYKKVLGVEAVESLIQNEEVRFVNLSSYDVTEDDILFVNGLAYSLVDNDHFKLFYLTNEAKITKRILIISNFNINNLDDIYVSRLTTLINPFDMEDDENDSSYNFDKYVYLTEKSSFGHNYFKSNVMPNEDEIKKSNVDNVIDNYREFKKTGYFTREDFVSTINRYFAQSYVNMTDIDLNVDRFLNNSIDSFTFEQVISNYTLSNEYETLVKNYIDKKISLNDFKDSLPEDVSYRNLLAKYYTVVYLNSIKKEKKLIEYKDSYKVNGALIVKACNEYFNEDLSEEEFRSKLYSSNLDPDNVYFNYLTYKLLDDEFSENMEENINIYKSYIEKYNLFDSISEEVYPFDSSSRMFNKHPLTNRIEGFHSHHAHHNCEYDDENQTTYDDTYMYVDCYNGKHGFTTKSVIQNRYCIVSHKLGKTPNFVNINPFANDIESEEGKFVGNIWWEADDENIYVYNDGNSTCEFEWFATYDENCKVETHEYEELLDFNKKDYLFYNITHSPITKLGYYGKDYLEYDKDKKLLAVHNANPNNVSYNYNLSYVIGKHITNKKFLEYSEDFTYNQDGYFDKNSEVPPTGKEIINYSGEFRSTKGTFYGNGIAQYLPISDFDKFETGDIVSYVDGVCKLADAKNKDTVIGVIADKDNIALYIDNYTTNKELVSLFGIQNVKVIGDISAGDKLGLLTDNPDLKGVATSGNGYVDNCYIGKALESYSSEDTVKTIKVLLTLV